jgi:hypothetical protein
MPTTVFAKGENKGMRKVTARKSTGAPAVRDEALFSPTGELAPTDMQVRFFFHNAYMKPDISRQMRRPRRPRRGMS